MRLLAALLLLCVAQDRPSLQVAEQDLVTTRTALRVGDTDRPCELRLTLGEWASLDRAIFKMQEVLRPPMDNVTWPDAVPPERMRVVFESVTVIVDLVGGEVVLRERGE